MNQSELKNLYRQADQQMIGVQQRYPSLICLTGCHACCLHQGSPITYRIEWLAIQALLERDPELKARVRQRFLAYRQKLRQALDQQQTLSVREVLFETPCPLLENGRCSVYDQRPMTCRAYGNTRLYVHSLPDNLSEIYTCDEEKLRWGQQLRAADAPPPQLPDREGLFAALEALDGAPPLTLMVFLERYLRDETC